MSDFESAVDAVISGDVAALRSMLQRDPELVRRRSEREHRATLLHYIAANGVEQERQGTPPNAVEVAVSLLQAGAEVDAPAEMYGAPCTTLTLLVSSTPPAEAGLQAALAETLLDHGAAFQSAVLTALAFGFLETAQVLAARGAPLNLAAFAGLGRVDDVARLLPASDPESRHVALVLAAVHGPVAVVRLLLDAGEDPNRFNPDGYHAHSTPLHQAVWSNQLAVVRELVERGARVDIRDTVHRGTPLDWAIYGGREKIAEYLSRGS